MDIALIVCGAPLTSRTPELVTALADNGFRCSVIGTPTSAPWLDTQAVKRLTGEPPRFEFRSPEQPKQRGRPEAVVVCPATFNTINKAVAGASDTYPLAVLNEALGAGLPTVVVPMVNDRLWGHPAWPASLGVFARCGAAMVNIHTGADGAAPVPSGTGDRVVTRFRPEWVAVRLAELLQARGR